jgi:hypothetical protein
MTLLCVLAYPKPGLPGGRAQQCNPPQILARITASRSTKSAAHFLSYDVNGRAHRVRVERLIFGGPPQAEGDAESPGSGGASPYLRRGSRVNLR